MRCAAAPAGVRSSQTDSLSGAGSATGGRSGVNASGSISLPLTSHVSGARDGDAASQTPVQYGLPADSGSRSARAVTRWSGPAKRCSRPDGHVQGQQRVLLRLRRLLGVGGNRRLDPCERGEAQQEQHHERQQRDGDQQGKAAARAAGDRPGRGSGNAFRTEGEHRAHHGARPVPSSAARPPSTHDSPPGAAPFPGIRGARAAVPNHGPRRKTPAPGKTRAKGWP